MSAFGLDPGPSLSSGGGTSFASARHVIYEALAGRRETAYGYVWRHAAKEP